VRILQDVDHQILGLLCEGNTHADIAIKIGCNKKTIQRKVAKWCSLLALPDRAGLTAAYLVHFPDRSSKVIPTALRTTLMRNDISKILNDADHLSREERRNSQRDEIAARTQMTSPSNHPMHQWIDSKHHFLAGDDAVSVPHMALANPLLWRDVVENTRELRFNTNILNGRIPEYQLIDSLLFGGSKIFILNIDLLVSRIESDSKIWLIASLAARALDLSMPSLTDVEREYLADNGHVQRLRWQRELQFTLDLGEGAYSRFAGINFWVLLYPQLLSRSRRVPNPDLMAGALISPLCPIVGMLVRLMATSNQFYDGTARFAGNAEPWQDWLKILVEARNEHLESHNIDIKSILASIKRT
jgi:hypothetical protein